MDWDGFKLMDDEYQKALNEHKEKITQKWDSFYLNKVYPNQAGKEEAMATDARQRLEKIKQDVDALTPTLEKVHFDGKSRADYIEFVKKTERKEKYMEAFKDARENSNRKKR